MVSFYYDFMCHCGLDPQSFDFQAPCFLAIAGQARNDSKNFTAKLIIIFLKNYTFYE